MKKLPLFALRHLSSMLLFAGLVSAAGAQTNQYTQLFTNVAPAGNQSVSTINWNAYIGATATNFTSGNVNAGGDIVGISLGSSNPSTDPAGVLFASPGTTAGQIFAATTTFTTAFDANTFTWREGNGATDSFVRLMVQQGGNWYASSQTFANTSSYTGGSFSSAGLTADTGKTFTFTTAAASWRLVTLTSGSTLSVSSTALSSDLASSTITGVGFFFQASTQSQNMRIDSLNITGTATAIPEPSAYAVVVGLSVLGLVAGRRRVSRRS